MPLTQAKEELCPADNDDRDSLLEQITVLARARDAAIAALKNYVHERTVTDVVGALGGIGENFRGYVEDRIAVVLDSDLNPTARVWSGSRTERGRYYVMTRMPDGQWGHMSPLGLVDEIRVEFKDILERTRDEQQAPQSVVSPIEFTSLTDKMLDVRAQQSLASARPLGEDERACYLARNPFARSTASLDGILRLMKAEPTLATELRRQTEILGVNFLPPEQVA